MIASALKPARSSARRLKAPLPRPPATALLCLLGAWWLVALQGCSTPAGTCNPYFPAPRGASWTYRDTRQTAGLILERSVAVESVEASGRVVSATLRQNVHAVGQPAQSAGEATTVVRCAGGAVQLSVQGAAASEAGGSQSNAAVRAVLPGLPPADKLVPGYRWESQGRVETSDGGATVVTSIERQSLVDGLFPVKVGAGEYPQALRIATVETLKLATSEGERQAQQEIREWYVRGLGLVKRDTRHTATDDVPASAEELVSFTGLHPEP